MTQTPPTPTGPGWYDDPHDPLLLRYFDGVVWSAHTTPRRSPTADASTIGRATPGTIPGRAGNPAAWAGQGQPDTRGQQGPAPWQGAGMPPAGQGAYDRGWAVPRGDVLPDGQVLAEWWRRLLGRILDIVVVGTLTVMVTIPWLSRAASKTTDFLAATDAATKSGGPLPSQTTFGLQLLEILLPVVLIWILIAMVYETAFLLWRGATPGKMLVGTTVRRLGGPGRLSLATVLKRQVITVSAVILNFVPIVSIFAFGVGVIDPAWLLWDPKRQCLHDKVADTVVVLRNPAR